MYFKVDKPGEAKALLERALSLFEKGGEATDAHYSGALAGVAEAYYRMGNHAEALHYYEKALEEVRKHFGENMSYAILCENCAAVCERLGDTKKQNQYQQMADAVKQKLQ